MQKEIWTINRLLEWARNYFTTKEIPEPRLSAELLLSSVLNLSRMNLYLKYDLELNEAQLKKYKEFIHRRLNHEPIQYITGEAYFRKIRLEVDKNVLIPRPETELLVERAKKAISHISEIKKASGSLYAPVTGKTIEAGIETPGNNPAKENTPGQAPNKTANNNPADGMEAFAGNKKSAIYNREQTVNILEIGTGSGAIALSLLFEAGQDTGKEIPFDIIATDISSGALKTAIKNADTILDSGKKGRLQLFECDVIPQEREEFLKKYLKNIDIVISNPPYISGENYSKLEKQVKDFEPEEALNAGSTGTEKYTHILKKIKPFLNPVAAYVIFETDPLASNGLKEIIKAEFNGCDADIEKDYNGLDRIMAAFIKM